MAEVTTRQRLQELLKERTDRTDLEELTETIFSSYKNVDAANDYLKELLSQLEAATEKDKRDLSEQAGILAVALGDCRAAVEHLQQVKTRKGASHFLGRAYKELGRAQEALACLEAGRQGDQDPATDVLEVEILCDMRDAEAAGKVCDRLSKGVAEQPDSLYTAGRVLELEGAYDKAMEHYERAIELDPEHRLSLFRLALNCDLNGEDDRAMELYERCASLKPTFVGALVNLGVLSEDRGDYGAAIECYKRVLAIDPAHGRAQLFLKDAESSLTMRRDEERTRRLLAHDEALELPLSNFELSARSRNVLEKLNVRTLGDLIRLTEEQLLQFKNFGETSLEEIKDLLARNDLQLSSSRPPARLPDLLRRRREEQEEEEMVGTSIDELGLSTRSHRCMERLAITTIEQLTEHSEEELLSAPNFGRASVEEVKAHLAERGLSLSADEDKDEEEGEEEE